MKKYFPRILAIIWIIIIFRLTTVPDFKVTEDTMLSLIISNGGHFFFFGIQAVLLKLSSLSNKTSLGITSAYGLLIELIQRTVPGRSADPVDWILDTLGAILFLVILNKIVAKYKIFIKS